jgi:hypothetical protein
LIVSLTLNPKRNSLHFLKVGIVGALVGAHFSALDEIFQHNWRELYAFLCSPTASFSRLGTVPEPLPIAD